MKTAILATLVASAAAFAPASQKASTTALSAVQDLGAQAPLGLWDPMNLLKTRDEEGVERLRALELKHGRIAMLGVVGYLVTKAGVRLPGLEDVPSGLAALNNLPSEVVGQFFMTVFFMEIANRDHTGKAEFPGDFRNGYLDFGWDEQSDDWKMKKRAIELNNGRAAQMGLIGLMVHDAMGNLDLILP